MIFLRRVIRSKFHPLRVPFTLILLAIFWSSCYVSIKNRPTESVKGFQREMSLQFRSPLKSVPNGNSSLFGFLAARSLLPTEDNFQKPEAFMEENTIYLNLKELEKEENAVVWRLRARKENVLDVCRSGKFHDCHIATVLTERMFFFHRYDTSVCTVLKSASSTWRAHLRRVNGGPPSNQSMDNDHIRNSFLKRTIEDIVNAVNSSSKILTVRHPMTRLVSAFRNKYKNGNTMIPHRPRAEAKYHKRMVGTSWAERIHQFWLPALFANNMVPHNTYLKVGMKAPIDPSVLYSEEEYERLYHILKPKITFAQFLKFVLKSYEEGTPNDHWSLYYKCCCPCHFDYDYITKVETLSDDLKYISKKLGIPSDSNTTMNQEGKSGDSLNSDLEYYRNVPKTLRRELYKYLKNDMDLFGYELPKNFLI